MKHLIAQYQNQIGQANERVSFLHSSAAAEAAALLANEPQQYTDVSGHNFVWRIGQILGDANYFTAVRHEANGVYHFNPQRLS